MYPTPYSQDPQERSHLLRKSSHMTRFPPKGVTDPLRGSEGGCGDSDALLRAGLEAAPERLRNKGRMRDVQFIF